MSVRSYAEATARVRVGELLDPDSFRELLGPEARLTSPHLPALGLPCAFDDGVVTGSGTLDGQAVLVAAQEGQFMGGAVGEIHGAKIAGLLARACLERPAAVILLLESGGVRLQEANAGLAAVAQVMRSVLATRAAGIPVIGIIGGGNGCFGGMGMVARLCDWLIMSEEGRLGLSGPEVIETVMGVEEFDSRDRALVWRTTGGKHRYLLGEIHALTRDYVSDFRNAAASLLGRSRELSLDALQSEQQALAKRLERFTGCRDAFEVWARLGLDEPERLPLLDAPDFLQLAEDRKELAA